MSPRSFPRGRAIRLESIVKRWDDTVALDEVGIDVAPGSFTALLGPSGCGKSTLLRIVAGLEPASAGRVVIGEDDVTTRPADKRDLSMVFQSYALFPHLSVAENIVFGLRTRGVKRPERQARLERVAHLLGLEALLERKPAALSGGQQQRVALGRAVIAERSICLMDEPLSNLDAKLRQTMRTELRALQRELGFTMLYVTHDQVEAITMADQVVLMNAGRVEQAATPGELYERPATTFAARFIGTPPMNLIPAAALGEVGVRLERALGLAVQVGIRPEAMHPARGAATFEMAVTGAEYLGADALVQGRIGEAPVQMRVPGHAMPEVGGTVAMSVAADDFHVFDAGTGARVATPDPASLLARTGFSVATQGAEAPISNQRTP
ncbi:ABC transporter ATP-binding protein [Aquicoccus porphyridii]|uniref:ABC transporter ATP-binding protein n=1 Tax=Aquicoccus porphyridii TaxID=1852029 RepID=A0A5A9ZTG5_9RHOB|nr:ABC transporter ATP-binding protein [Aquicoccus porphyridii]KAA0920663.1 ABC transporter ATP-binding protein [Aquicoccus porphyridii]RAI56783.1 ABC transporter ATP-binding protein [Rhodobacteraceae bacterium AsT-22]